MNGILSLWAIYDRPTDFPDSFVARRWEVGPTREFRPTDAMIIDKSLGIIRALLFNRGLVCFPRDRDDAAHIVESWL